MVTHALLRTVIYRKESAFLVSHLAVAEVPALLIRQLLPIGGLFGNGELLFGYRVRSLSSVGYSAFIFDINSVSDCDSSIIAVTFERFW